MKHTYDYNGTTYIVDLNLNPDGTYSATIGDHSYTVSARIGQDGGLLLSLDNQQIRAYGAIEGDNRHLHINGQTYTLTTIDTRTSRRRASGANAGNLTAQMPGQVTEVHVNAGDTVHGGQTLVILEAMKMEIRVTAPTDGTINKVLVKKGDVVERGQLLVELASDSV